MIIGVLKERKKGEHRVALTPSGASLLKHAGHTILVETGAGVGSGYEDIHYKNAGASVCAKAIEVAHGADMVVKIKEPIPREYKLLKMLKGKMLCAYLHLAASPKKLTETLLKHTITAIAYETIEDGRGRLPLLAPMSSVAGVAAIQYAAEYLQKKHGGCGVTLGNIPGAERARVVVVGGGTAGAAAAKTASGMGAAVTILEKRRERIAELQKIFQRKKVAVVNSNKHGVSDFLDGAHVLVGATLVSGAKAEHVVSKEQVLLLSRGAVIVDISIDQGGCIWGSEPTVHDKPVFIKEERVYCCVTNIPGQFPAQSTQALTAKTISYIQTLANNDFVSALSKDRGLAKGVHAHAGFITHEAVAKSLAMQKQYKDLGVLLEEPPRRHIVS